MQFSPRGRFIQYVEGSPSGIIERGEAITVLGDQMLNSARVLQGIKSSALDHGGQQGKAIDTLRESIGDSYQVLQEAGELYQPVGPVITTYGEALDAVQPLIRSAVDDAQELWTTFVSLPGQVEPRGIGGFLQPDEGSPEADRQAEEDAEKKAAYDAWEARATDFDTHYDTWEEAFDTAVSGVSDSMSDAIKDSRWSMFAEVLGWAALVVGVAAMIIGGPLLAAIALAVGALYLIAVYMQSRNGEADGGDIAMAALGVVPFGKVAGLTRFAHLSSKGAKATPLVSKFTALSGLLTKPLKMGDEALYPLFKSQGAAAGFKKLLTGDPDGLAGYLAKHADYAGDLAHMSSVGRLARIDLGASTAGNLLDYYGKLDKVTGGSVLPDVPNPVKIGF